MKKIIKRFVLGSVAGISIGYLISLIISVIKGQGIYYGASPQLISTFGSEINAMVVQTLASMIIGGVYSSASYIFDETNYSITKQTILHFLTTTPVYLGVGYLCGWWSLSSLIEILLFIGIYVVIYIIIWTVFYLYWKNKLSKLNEEIKKIS